MNLPLCGLAISLVSFFLDVKAPKTTLREKIDRMDYGELLSETELRRGKLISPFCTQPT